MEDIEELTASLVREYLSRKGFKSTLKILDSELPRNEKSISNRAQLAKEIHIERLMKKNKEVEPESFRTMLEVIVKYMKDRNRPGSSDLSQANQVDSTVTSPRRLIKDSELKLEGTRLQRPSSKSGRRDRDKESENDNLLTKKRDTDISSSDKRSNLNYELHDKDFQISDQGKRHQNKRVIGLGPTSTSGDNSSSDSVGLSDNSRTGILTGNDNISLDSDISAKTNRSGNRGRVRHNRGINGPIMSSGLGQLKNGHRHHHDRKKHLFKSDVNEPIIFSDDVGKASVHSRDDSHKVTSTGSYNDEYEQGKKTEEPSQDLLNDLVQKPTPSFLQSNRRPSKSKSDELIFEDIDDDFGQELSNIPLGGPPKSMTADFTSKVITLEIAKDLKNLIFGTANSCFNAEWSKQGFGFSDLPELQYGIVQHKGGPCGILASVQAILLKHLMLEANATGNSRIRSPSSSERITALSLTVCEVLWRCGENKAATVALPSMGSKFTGGIRYKSDGITESLTLYSFKTKESLLSFVRQNISQFENGSGVILLLYSAVLSRTIPRVKSDMDEPTGKLLGAHNYCTQEMVNLLLTGKAFSNVFDNIIKLDQHLQLKGLEKQNEIGLLSLFEHYGSCEVGSFYKTPKFPIWVVCSESHFSVLFSININLLGDRRLQRKFDLYYYDGLARQDEEIHLTVDTTREPEYSEGDLIPPLELCIRTKWNNAHVDWNGSEPIL